MKYSEKEMAALISEVEAQFQEHLAKAEQEQVDLKKSESTPAEGSLEKTQEDNIDYDAEDLKEVDGLYNAMTKAEKEIHLNSLKKAIGEETIIVKTEAKPVEAVKTETVKIETVVTPSPELSLLKTEKETLSKENVELKKSLDSLTGALTKFFKDSKAPKQKAITKIEYVKKSEADAAPAKPEVDVKNISKNDIAKRLTQKIRTGTLQKSDRDAIDSYYNGNIALDAIKHLL